MPDARIATPLIQIDWNEDGTFDDVSADIRNAAGITVQQGKDSARPRAQPMVAAADFTLGNQNHRYTSENSGSDIYPYVIPDRPVSIGVSQGEVIGYEAAITYDAVEYYNGVGALNIITGYTDEPVEMNSAQGVERHVQFRCLGSMSVLRGMKVSTALYSGIRTDEAVGHLLDAAGWPDTKREISTGDTTMNWWWLDNEDAWDALVSLLETEGAGASLYEDGSGVLHFENRLYRAIQTRSTTSQATFDTTAANPGFTDFTYSQGRRDVYNDISMSISISYAYVGVTVWEYGGPLTIAASDTRTILLHVDDPIDVVIIPVLTTDYVVTSGSLISYTAEQINANTVQLTFVAGGGGVTIDGPGGSTNGPRLRANQLREAYQEKAYQSAAPSPMFSSRMRSLDLNEAGASHYVSQPTAQTLCDAAANFYTEGRPAVQISFVNRDEDRLNQLLQRQISDRITVNAGANEFAGECWIDQLNYEIRDAGRVARCSIVAGRATSGTGGGYVENPGLWDAAEWDAGLWGN